MADFAQAVARVNGTVPAISVAVGRRGFRAELDGLRERMRGLEFGYDEIAAELPRRYQLCPREAYRLAYGWSLGHAARDSTTGSCVAGKARLLTGIAGMTATRVTSRLGRRMRDDRAHSG
jgi:hypothetical protein